MVDPKNHWLTQKTVALFFEKDRTVISKHLKNIFESNELQESSVCAKFAHTAQDGKTYNTNHYISDFDKEILKQLPKNNKDD